MDLEEIPYGLHVNSLLEKTCGLSRTYPFTASNDTEATLANKCPPAVSIYCKTGLLIKFIFQYERYL